MKSYIIANMALFIVIFLFEFILIREGLNDYPGTLTAFVVIIAAVMFAANYRKTKQ